MRTFEVIKGYINSTTTRKGLVVTGVLARGGNEIGERVSNEEMATLNIRHHEVCPTWNYAIRPRENATCWS